MARKSKAQIDLETKMALLKQAKDMGLSSVKIGDVEFQLGQPKEEKPAQKAEERELKAEEILTPPNILDQLTDEEILYYATPFFSELQERKRLAQEAAKQKEAIDG